MQSIFKWVFLSSSLFILNSCNNKAPYGPIFPNNSTKLVGPATNEPSIEALRSQFAAPENSLTIYHAATWSENTPGFAGRLFTYGGLKRDRPGTSLNSFDPDNKLQAFDPITQKTETIDVPGLRALFAPNMIANEAGIFVWGGASLVEPPPSNSHSSEFKFENFGLHIEPAAGTTREIPINGAPSPRHQPLMASVDRRFLLFGGYVTTYGNNTYTKVGFFDRERQFIFNGSVFDADENSWTGTAPFFYPKCKGEPSILGSDGKSIFMWGIKSKTGQGCATRFDLALYRYDLDTNEWSANAVDGALDLPFATEVTGSVLGDKLWIAWVNAATESNNQTNKTVEVAYIDLNANKWMPVGKLTFGHAIAHPFRTIASPKGLYVFVESICRSHSSQASSLGIITPDGSTSIVGHEESFKNGYYCESLIRGESLTLTPFGVIGWGGAFHSDKYYSTISEFHRIYSMKKNEAQR